MAAPTYVTHVGFGHTVDELAYKVGGTTFGWTLVSGTPNYIETIATNLIQFTTSRDFTALTNIWISCSLLRHVGQIATGVQISVLRFKGALTADNLTVTLLQSTDNDHFVIRLTGGIATNVIATGTLELAVDTDFTLLIWEDGSKLRMKVNGTEDDINIAHTPKINSTRIAGMPSTVDNLGSGDKIRIGPIAIHHSDAEADRPGVVVSSQVVYPDGNNLQEYGDDADCSEDSTDGDYTDVDDWASGVVDDATYICEQAAELGNFRATMTTVTVVNNFTGCRFIIRNRANVDSKAIRWDYLIRDGSGNQIAKVGANLGSDSFATKSMEFPTAPDAGAWTQSDLDGLLCGVRSRVANEANDQHSVFMFEVCTIDLDPPPAVSLLHIRGRPMRPLIVR